MRTFMEKGEKESCNSHLARIMKRWQYNGGIVLEQRDSRVGWPAGKCIIDGKCHLRAIGAVEAAVLLTGGGAG